MSAPAAASSTRERILDAAELLFAERGLAGTAVRDIATQVNLNPASLYNHFPSKLALYEAVLERGVRPLLAVLQGVDPAGATTVGDQVIQALMEHLGRTPHLPRLIHHEAATGGVHLVRLARLWIRPLIDEALSVLHQNSEPGVWSEDEYPLLIEAWLHIIIGYFSMAPLLAEVFDGDPLSSESLARQTRFLRKLNLRIVGPSAEARPESAPEDPQ
ncbi:TetR/AcrR family transcriptional regulator [Myxococcota bacterium]|nr:TetR/AcrR family transcriptional regulator [Myxococcota bacterium]